MVVSWMRTANVFVLTAAMIVKKEQLNQQVSFDFVKLLFYYIPRLITRRLNI